MQFITYKLGNNRWELERFPFHSLLDCLTHLSNQFILVDRREFKLEENDEMFLKDAQPFLIKAVEDNKWPGGGIIKGPAVRVFHFKCNQESVNLLKKYAETLLLGNLRLEDLSFSRKDGTPIFISVRHEDMYWLELTEKEFDFLKTRMVSIESKLIPQRERRKK